MQEQTMNSEENHIEGNSPTEQQAHANVDRKKNKFILRRFFGSLKEFIDKGKTDAVRSEPPPITNYDS